MDDFEQKIEAVLQDPEQMQRIMEMAQSLGLNPNDAQSVAHTAEPAGKEVALLEALRPFLQPRHRRKLERAMQITKLSKLAKLAMERSEENRE